MTAIGEIDEAVLDAARWRQVERLLAAMPAHVDEGDRTGDLPAGLLAAAPADALNRMNVPVNFGGLSATATARSRADVFERVGRICPALPMALPGPGLAMPPVLSLGTEEQKQAFFALFTEANGPRFAAFAITEPQGGSDAVTMRTTAIRDGDAWVLDGEKCFITNGARADVTVVFATIAPDKGRFGIRAFLVPAGTPGFRVDRREDMLGLRASQLASLSFTGCRLPLTAMLGHNGRRGPFIDAFTGAQSAWNYMRPALAAGINGACLGALDEGASLLRQGVIAGASRRAAAGVMLAQFRARTATARRIALAAADRFDAGEDASLAASMAKAFSATLAMELAEALASTFPSEMLRRGSRIEKFGRDAKAFDILEGTGEMQRLMIARAYDPSNA